MERREGKEKQSRRKGSEVYDKTRMTRGVKRKGERVETRDRKGKTGGARKKRGERNK